MTPAPLSPSPPILPPPAYAPPPGPLVLVYADRDLVVIDKPSGLLSVPGRGEDLQDSAWRRVQVDFPTALAGHRLDMDTSGLLIFALRRKAEAALRAQFQQHRVYKRYLARVWGRVEAEEGWVEQPLSHDPLRPPLSRLDPLGRPARTCFQVLSRAAASTRVALLPETGRSHQLRLHMQSLGHPILGDRFYASGEALAAAPRLMLHAAALAFDHPYDGRRVALEVGPDFALDGP